MYPGRNAVRRICAALSLVACLLAASAAAESPLIGVWQIEEIRTVGPSVDVTNSEPQPGLYIFTAGFYSMVWSPGGSPGRIRPRSGNRPTRRRSATSTRSW